MFRRSLILLLTLCAVPALADSALVGLTRVEQASPWKAVGRLDTSDGSYCTATLIAPDLVLSAAHCVYTREGQRLAPGDLVFRAGYREGRVEAERKVLQIALPDAYDYNSGDPKVRIANDVVLLRLHTPVASHIIAPFVVEQRTLDHGEVTVVSYGQGRDAVPSLQSTCAILRSFDGVMVMSCDTTFGSSGAPVFIRDGIQIKIASIVSGSARIDGVQRTTGMALPEIVATLKAKLIAEGAPPPAVLNRMGAGTRAAGGAKFIRPGGS